MSDPDSEVRREYWACMGGICAAVMVVAFAAWALTGPLPRREAPRPRDLTHHEHGR